MKRPRAEPRLLVAEDDDGDFELLCGALKGCGLERKPERLVSGEALLARLGRKEPGPTLVLLDLQMPGMGGIEALRRLRRDPDLFGLPVVVLTTNADPVGVAEAYRAGANAYMTKPMGTQEFEDKIRRFLGFWLATAELPLPEETPWSSESTSCS